MDVVPLVETGEEEEIEEEKRGVGAPLVAAVHVSAKEGRERDGEKERDKASKNKRKGERKKERKRKRKNK